MVTMTPKVVLLFCAPLACASAGLAVLTETNSQTGASNLFPVMITRLTVVMLLAVFGMFAAQGGNMAGSVLMTAPDWRTRVQEIINYGVLPGFVLGILNYLFFFFERYSPSVNERIRQMENVYDVLLVSLDTAVFEEIIYRLFVLSCFVFLFRHLYREIHRVQPKLVSLLPPTMGIVLSSLLFAVEHSVAGFTAAFAGGIILGFIYFRSGVESAIAAHFAANFLFFSASYLV